jgi:hypothetical protein
MPDSNIKTALQLAVLEANLALSVVKYLKHASGAGRYNDALCTPRNNIKHAHKHIHTNQSYQLKQTSVAKALYLSVIKSGGVLFPRIVLGANISSLHFKSLGLKFHSLTASHDRHGESKLFFCLIEC